MSAQLAGPAGLHHRTRLSPSVTTMDLTAFCLFLPETKRSRSGGRAAAPDLGAVDDAALPGRAEMVHNVGEGPESHVGADGASAFREQGPHLADGPGGGGAVHAEPAGRHVMSNPMAKMHESGQEPVDEHQPVLRAGSHSTLPRPRGKPVLAPFMPQRP